MKISIALASFNGARYLQAQLDSFSEQTRCPDEIVVSDDGSTDDTLEIVEQFSASAPFHVRVLRGDRRLGYAGNFSRALEATTGDLVFLSDQDDVWFPDKIETMERFFLDAPEAYVIMCDAMLTDCALLEYGVTKLGQIRSAGIPDGEFVMGCCAAVRRSFLDLVMPIPEAYPAHDVWLVKMADGVGRKRVNGVVLQYYRRHGRNESLALTNRLEKITRKDVFHRGLRNLRREWRGDAHPLVERQLKRAILFLEGVERAVERSNRDQAEWEVYAQENRAYVAAVRARFHALRTTGIRRTIGILRLWFGGCYGKGEGRLSTACRDLLSARVVAGK